MTIFFLFSTSKKVRGPEAEKSANRTGSGRGKGPISKSDCPDLRGLCLLVSDLQNSHTSSMSSSRVVHG